MQERRKQKKETKLSSVRSICATIKMCIHASKKSCAHLRAYEEKNKNNNWFDRFWLETSLAMNCNLIELTNER